MNDALAVVPPGRRSRTRLGREARVRRTGTAGHGLGVPAAHPTQPRCADAVDHPTHVFPAELPAWRSPAFTGSQSHAVVDVTPGGLIDADGGGLGRPTPSGAGAEAPELTLLPPPRPTSVQRTVRPGAAAPRPATASESDDVRPGPSLTRAPSVGMPLVHRAVIDDPAPPDPVTDPVPEPEPEPVEQNESVAPEYVDSAEPPPSAEGEAPTTSAGTSDGTATPVDQVVPPLAMLRRRHRNPWHRRAGIRDGATQRGRATGSGSHIHVIGDTGR